MVPWAADGWGTSVAVGGAVPTAPVVTNARSFSTQNTLFNIASGGSTYSNRIRVLGTSLYLGATVNITLDTVAAGTTVTDAVTGGWNFDLGVLTDATHAVTATITVSGNTSVNSNTYNFTVIPSLTSLPVGIGGNITDSQSLTWAGNPFGTISNTTGASNPATCVVASSHQLDYTVLPTDAEPTGSNRSEMESAYYWLGTFGTPEDVTYNVTYEFLLSSGSPENNCYPGGPIGGAWMICGQLHDGGAGNPIMSIAFGVPGAGDAMQVIYYNGATQFIPHNPGVNTIRGVWHSMDFIMKPSNTASIFQLWINGTQVVNVTNFDKSPRYYWKMGCYRGPPAGSGQTQTQIIRYRNFLISIV